MSHVFKSSNETPAVIAFGPYPDPFFINIIAGDILNLSVSDNGGAAWTAINRLFPVNIILNSAKDTVDYLNLIMRGTAPFDIKWYVTNDGKGFECRTNSLFGPFTKIRFDAADLSEFIGVIGNTGVGGYSFPYFISLPTPKEPLTALSINLAQQALRNRSQSLYSNMAYTSNKLSTINAISTDGTTIDIPSFTSIYFRSGRNYVGSMPDTTLTPTVAASTWYYVYQGWTTFPMPHLDYEVSTTPPDMYHLFKSGSPGKKYLFSFVTDSMAKIIPFRRNGQYTSYLSIRNVLTGGSALTPTIISCSSLIPPTSRLGRFEYKMTTSGGGLRSISFYDTIVGFGTTFSFANARNQISSFNYPMDSGATQLSYNVSVASIILDLAVLGYYE